MDKTMCVGLLIGVAAGAICYKKCGRFKSVIDKADNFLMQKAEKTKDVVSDCMDDVKENIQKVVSQA